MNVPANITMVATAASKNHGHSIGIDGGPGCVESAIGLDILTWEMTWMAYIKIVQNYS